MNKIKHFVVFSHGFGVRKNATNLFPDIAAALGDVESVLFDYNAFNSETNEITINTLGEQSRMLRGILDGIKEREPDAVIDLVCHSQGCAVAAIAEPQGIRKTVLLAPPDDLSIARSIERASRHPGAVIDLEGVSRLPRSDGSVRIVPAEYWKERQQIDAMTLYEAFARQTKLTIVQAKQDHVLGETSFSSLEGKAQVLAILGNHDFTGSARSGVCETVKSILF